MSRIGIFFNARREQGGLYQYAVTLVDCLARYAAVHEYIVYNATLNDLALQPRPPVVTVVDLPSSAVRLRMLAEVFWLQLARHGYRGRGWIPEYSRLRQARLDAVLYVKPGVHSFFCRYPNIFPVHDLQHRLQPHFPEVSAGGEFRRREYIYRNAVPAAAAILTDSLAGKEDVVALYGADPHTVHPLPYLASTMPSHSIDPGTTRNIKDRYRLPARYFFYPAAFWQHKNHARIIEALRLLRDEEGLRVDMVFAGGLRHEYQALTQLVAAYSLLDQVHFIGYVPDEDLPSLYQGADALVMPTFFGPTNIPVLEAWVMGCPVISSDIRGIREQVGEAGILVDPCDERQLAHAMRELYISADLRRSLAAQGRQRVAQWTPPMFTEQLESIITCALSRGVEE
jgi:glycosyltransferase involved in cell wall biosynthesis